MSINNKVTEILGIKTFESKETRPKRMYGKYQQISLPYMYLLRALNTRQLECFRQKQPTAAKKRLRAREKRVAMQKKQHQIDRFAMHHRCIHIRRKSPNFNLDHAHTRTKKHTDAMCMCTLETLA